MQFQAFAAEPFKDFGVLPYFYFFLGWLGVMLFVSINQKTNSDFVKQSFEVLGWERQFKSIFDNLDEPVVIISEDQALYTNNPFIQTFEADIKTAMVTKQEV